MAPPRLVGVNFTPAQYREVLTANVTSSMVANGVVFPYHGVSMKQTPRWDEVVPLRHLIKDLLDRSGGAGVLQASWFAACKEFFKDGRYDVKMDQVEKVSYAIRTIISQFREYKRSRGNVPTRYQATLRPLIDAISSQKLHDLNTSERAVGEEKKDGSMASEEGGDAKSSGSEDLQVVPVSAPVEETIFVASETSIESDDSYRLFCDGSVVETAPAVATPSPSALVVLPTIDDLLLGVPTSGIQPARWAKLNKEIKSKGPIPRLS